MKFKFPIALFIILIMSCSKSSNIKHSSDWLLPLVKGNITFETLKTLSRAKTSISIPSIDLGYTSGTTVNIPPISNKNLGPYKIPLNNWIHKIQFDSLEILFSFKNLFPIETGAGTKFSFRRTANVNDSNNIIYQYITQQNISANGNINFDIVVNNNFINDTIFLFVEEYNSPGANNVTFSAQPSIIDIEVKIIDINYVELYSDKSALEKDTLDIDFSKEETPTDTSNYGIVNIFIDNGLPIQFGIQIYFLDPSTNSYAIDSLWNPTFDIAGSNTDANGTPQNIQSKKSSVSISTQRLDKIKKSKKGVIKYQINTLGYPPPYVRLNKDAFLKLQITGDLHLNLNLK